jgi:hypothetical protein
LSLPSLSSQVERLRVRSGAYPWVEHLKEFWNLIRRCFDIFSLLVAAAAAAAAGQQRQLYLNPWP